MLVIRSAVNCCCCCCCCIDDWLLMEH